MPGDRGLEAGVADDAVPDLEPGARGEHRVGPHAGADDDRVAVDREAALGEDGRDALVALEGGDASRRRRELDARCRRAAPAAAARPPRRRPARGSRARSRRSCSACPSRSATRPPRRRCSCRRRRRRARRRRRPRGSSPRSRRRAGSGCPRAGRRRRGGCSPSPRPRSGPCRSRPPPRPGSWPCGLAASSEMTLLPVSSSTSFSSYQERGRTWASSRSAVAAQVLLRQGRAVVGRLRLPADEQDRALGAELAELRSAVGGGDASADEQVVDLAIGHRSGFGRPVDRALFEAEVDGQLLLHPRIEHGQHLVAGHAAPCPGSARSRCRRA